jgi:hypothetical protein
MFAISERSGKDHDLDEVLTELTRFLAAEGFAS